MLQCLEGINPKGSTAVQGILYCLRDYSGISNWWPERKETTSPDFTQQYFLSKTEESEITFKAPREDGMFPSPPALSLQLLALCIFSAPLTPSPTAHITPCERVLKYEIRKSVTCQEHPQLLMLQWIVSQITSADILDSAGAESLTKWGFN